jgi:hypothetical protein
MVTVQRPAIERQSIRSIGHFHLGILRGLVDVANSTYNASGSITGGEFKFPYPSETFDLVFCMSVFTHTLPNTTTNYLVEISRIQRTLSLAYPVDADTRQG